MPADMAGDRARPQVIMTAGAEADDELDGLGRERLGGLRRQRRCAAEDDGGRHGAATRERR